MSTTNKSSKPKRASKHSLMYCRGRRIARNVAGQNRMSEAALVSLEGGMNEFMNRLLGVAIETMKSSDVCIKPGHVVAGLEKHPNMKAICADQLHRLRVRPSQKAVPVRRVKNLAASSAKKGASSAKTKK